MILKLAVRAFGDFSNPIGMAAGFDKGADAPPALLRRASASSRRVGDAAAAGGQSAAASVPDGRDEAVINRFGFDMTAPRRCCGGCRGAHRRRIGRG